jgi:hypothetical protein
MSDRALYKKVPLDKRVCSWIHCQDPIKRNLIRSKDGRLWHYGCYNNARDTHFECKVCFSTYDGTEVIYVEGGVGEDFRQQWKPTCPSCGADLKGLNQAGAVEF